MNNEATKTTSFIDGAEKNSPNSTSKGKISITSIRKEYSEQSPNGSVRGQEFVDSHEEKISCRFFFIGPVLFIMIFNFVVNALINIQYAYSYFGMEKFPETFSNFSSGKSCLENKSSQAYLDQQEVQKIASRYSLYCTLCKGIPGLIANMVFAALSDKYGRKPFIRIITAGSFIATVLLTLAIYLKWRIYFLLPFMCLEGMTGGWIASLSLGFAAVADVTKIGKSRVFAIVLCEITVGMGALAGTISSGYLIDSLGYYKSMMVSSGVACVGFMFTTILQETLQKKHVSALTTIETLRNIVLFYTRYSSSEGKRWKFWACLSTLFFVFLANFGKNNVETLYELNSPFCWSSITVGWYNTLRAGVPLVIGMILLKPLQKCMDDYVIAVFGTLSASAGYVLEGFAFNKLMMISAAIIAFMGALPVPITRAVMSHMTPPEKQGSMFAGIAAIETICTVIGGVAANAVYAATVEWSRGFVFFVFSGLTGVAFVLVVILLISSIREKRFHLKSTSERRIDKIDRLSL